MFVYVCVRVCACMCVSVFECECMCGCVSVLLCVGFYALLICLFKLLEDVEMLECEILPTKPVVQEVSMILSSVVFGCKRHAWFTFREIIIKSIKEIRFSKH